MKVLENKTLVLKGLDFEYVEDMYEYGRDENVARHAGFQQHASGEDAFEMMTRLKNMDEVWGIYHKEDDKLIGTLGIHYGGKHPIHKTVVYGIGFELNPKYWGRGIMKMACDLALDHFFFDLDGKAIYANHFKFNQRSKQFLVKYGMIYEGDWLNQKRQVENSIYVMTKDHYINKRSLGYGK